MILHSKTKVPKNEMIHLRVTIARTQLIHLVKTGCRHLSGFGQSDVQWLWQPDAQGIPLIRLNLDNHMHAVKEHEIQRSHWNS